MEIGVPQFVYAVHLSDSSSDRTLIYSCASFHAFQAGAFALRQNDSYDTVDKIVDADGNTFTLNMTPPAVAVEKEPNSLGLGALTYKNKLECVKSGDMVEEGEVYVVTNRYYSRDDSGADVYDANGKRTIIASVRKGEIVINVEQKDGVIKSISETSNASEFKPLVS